MAKFIWSYDELVKLTKWDDPEVRFWAVDRLIRHHPERCCDAIAEFLLDDHEATPGMIARHLGEHGGSQHHAILLRGFRLLRGLTPGLCLQSLARLGHASVVDLAATALERGDLTDPALGIIVDALADLGTEEAHAVVRRYVDKRVDLLADPSAMRGVLKVIGGDELPGLLERYFRALPSKGTHHGGETFRVLMDALQIDDASWCFRTGPSGRLELRKTIKAVESGYDCDIQQAMGEATLRQLHQKFRSGSLDDIVQALAAWTRTALNALPADAEDDLPARMAAAVEACATDALLDGFRRLGHAFQRWVLGFQLSAAFAAARYQNTSLRLKRARGNLDRLLELAAVETAFLLPELPPAIAVVCREDPEKARKAQDWCLRMLESQGPFFPRVVALETLGELRAIHFVPEIMDYLGDENTYVYGAAERALAKMGEAIVIPAREALESRTIPLEATHSLLVLLCELGTRSAFDAVFDHIDFFMHEVGPGTAAEWVSLFGAEELIEPLRYWLEEDPALVGQGLLLLGAIHDVPIPEEPEIQQAIADERARQREGEDDEQTEDGAPDGGRYLM